MRDLAGIVGAYDIRGEVPTDLDESIAEAIGAAFVRVLEARAVVTAHDMRASSVPLSRAFAAGAAGQGADVIETGLGSTDMLYLAAGIFDVPGAMFTASHNPARFNGIKLCRAGAAPVGQDTGLADIRALAELGLLPRPGVRGEITRRDVLQQYADHLRGLVDISGIRRLTVAVDAGNGMAGHTVPIVFAGLPIDLVPLYFELDGTFPNHEANPLVPENLLDLRAAVVTHGADLGLAFDGDADRCFVVDERGEPVPPSAVTALVAARELLREPGSTIIYNLITSHAVPEIVRERGGIPVRTRVGHSFIKAEMARTGAIFGGEHSAHYYFRDFWRADTGMLAALHVLAELGSQEAPLSELVAQFGRYAASGEINSVVTDPPGTLRAVEAAFAGRAGALLDRTDGLTIELADRSWFNVRPSNTEALLRLNVEAPDDRSLAALRDEVLSVVRAPVPESLRESV